MNQERSRIYSLGFWELTSDRIHQNGPPLFLLRFRRIDRKRIRPNACGKRLNRAKKSSYKMFGADI